MDNDRGQIEKSNLALVALLDICISLVNRKVIHADQYIMWLILLLQPQAPVYGSQTTKNRSEEMYLYFPSCDIYFLGTVQETIAY